MVDLAGQAFSTKNFDLAVDIYERQLKEYGPGVDLYVGLADSYAKSGRIQQAIENYRKAYRLSSVSPDRLNHLIDSLVDVMVLKSTMSEQSGKSEDQDVDMFCCDICKTMWRDPITVGCGHTFCKLCLEKRTSKSCGKCKKALKHSKLPKVNVLLQRTVDQWFGAELQAVTLKAEGNALFQNRNYEEAIKVYSQALEYAPKDHLLVSNRSYAYASMQMFNEALSDAELATKLRPDWPKGYFRKGCALEGLSRWEEAAYSYLQCLSLDLNVVPARAALGKMLNKILSPLSPEELKPAELQNLLHMSPLIPMFQESSLQESSQGRPVPTSLLSAKHSLIASLMQQQELQSAATANPRQQQQQLATNEQRYTIPSVSHSDPHSSKCQSLPSSPQSSPTALKRSFGSASSLESLHRAQQRADSRKRGVDSAQPLSPARSPTNSKLKKMTREKKRFVPEELLRKEEFECSLCMRLLYDPVTTPCGHAFCRQCLDRCLDHNASCPLCKMILAEYLAERQRCTTEAIENIVRAYFPDEFDDRKVTYERELEEFAKMGVDNQHEIPIFVCTLAYPTVACPLHVFEPRYRLMIRQCMESGTRQFGMCVCFDDNEENFADYGCMLEVRDVQYFPDGRSVVDTVGGRRFKVLRRASRDGYNTAHVEFLEDTPTPLQHAAEVLALHDEVYAEARAWFQGLPRGPQSRITQHFGGFPDREPDILALPNGPAWLWWELAVLPLDPRAQLSLLAMTSLRERLLGIRRVIQFMRQRGSATQ